MENPSLPSFIARTSFFCISVNDEYDGKQSWLKLKIKKNVNCHVCHRVCGWQRDAWDKIYGRGHIWRLDKVTSVVRLGRCTTEDHSSTRIIRPLGPSFCSKSITKECIIHNNALFRIKAANDTIFHIFYNKSHKAYRENKTTWKVSPVSNLPVFFNPRHFDTLLPGFQGRR